MIVQGLSFTVVNTNESRFRVGESNSSIVLGEIMKVMTPEKLAFLNFIFRAITINFVTQAYFYLSSRKVFTSRRTD